MATEKIIFKLSKTIAKKLKEIPSSKRRRFIEKALKRQFLVEDRLRFIRNYKRRKKPIWTDENHLDLNTPEDFANYRPLTWRMDKK